MLVDLAEGRVSISAFGFSTQPYIVMLSSGTLICTVCLVMAF